MQDLIDEYGIYMYYGIWFLAISLLVVGLCGKVWLSLG